jgi:uncharacterized protein
VVGVFSIYPSRIISRNNFRKKGFLTMINQATVNTEKAERLMKALCNHFARKTNASYEGEKGIVDFGDGRCDLTASATTLTLLVEAATVENLARIQHVVGDHLQRFTPEEPLEIEWGSPADAIRVGKD